MKTIKEIIKDINILEKDFDIFNKRILEFSKSTNSSSIDTDLLKKYISGLNNYLKLLNGYKRELDENINKDNLEEYQATKKLMLVRIENLEKILNNNIKKLKLILKSVDFKKDSKNIEVDFSSKDEVFEINKNLYDFYNLYNQNLEFQRKYNIKLSLNNDFENKIEKELNSLELTKKEKDYLENINSIFEEIDDLNDKLNNKINKTIDIEKKLFKKGTIEEYYKDYFQLIFNKYFKDSYEFDNFNILNSYFNKDFYDFKKELEIGIKKLSIILNLYFFSENKQYFLELDNKYNIFNNQGYIKNIFNIYDAIKNKHYDFESFYENISGLIGIKNIYDSIKNFDISLENFKESFSFLKKINEIYKNRINDFDFGFFESLFFSMTSSNSEGEVYLKNGLNNLKKSLITKLNKVKTEDKKEIIVKYIVKLNNIETYIISLKKAITGVYYSPGITKGSYKKSVTYYLDELEKSFNFINQKSKYYNSFLKYLFAEINSRYNSSRSSYYSTSNSGGYSGGSYSGGASWGGSSGGFSSSYSSSGSSSW